MEDTMGKKTEVITLDDINGAPGAETVIFGYQGRVYEIDLAPENMKRFDEIMQEFADHARVVRLSGKPATLPTQYAFRKDATRPAVNVTHRRKIRNWWQVQPDSAGLPPHKGFGRIPEQVVEAYEQVQGRR
jgi:hypothetical protein